MLDFFTRIFGEIRGRIFPSEISLKTPAGNSKAFSNESLENVSKQTVKEL